MLQTRQQGTAFPHAKATHARRVRPAPFLIPDGCLVLSVARGGLHNQRQAFAVSQIEARLKRRAPTPSGECTSKIIGFQAHAIMVGLAVTACDDVMM